SGVMPTERREGAIRVGATGQRATGGARRFQRKAAVFGGWHEPDESRGSCPDLGAARGETPRADSANPPVAFDVAGAGDVAWSRGISAKAGAPVLDPTDERGRETGSYATPAPFLDSTTSGAVGCRTPEFESEINVLWEVGVTTAKNSLFFGPRGLSRGTCRKCLMGFTELRRGTR